MDLTLEPVETLEQKQSPFVDPYSRHGRHDSIIAETSPPSENHEGVRLMEPKDTAVVQESLNNLATTQSPTEEKESPTARNQSKATPSPAHDDVEAFAEDVKAEDGELKETIEPSKASESWQDTVRQVREHRDATVARVLTDKPSLPENPPERVIPVIREHLSTEAIAITESSVENLVVSLAAGKVTATTVAQAFLRRAALAQKLVNCVFELLPERALARAKELDEHFAKHGPVGPLHGLPISVKAHIGMKDLDNPVGFVAWVGRKSAYDSMILQILQEAGAILYVRTTEPQGLMALETNSNLMGRTVNPHNSALTAGGSSGGEGALMGLSGSVLGIGSDIGGSIRAPAANCGVYGLKPSAGRLPLMGLGTHFLGCDTISGVVGPLSSSIDGLDLFMKAALDSKPWLKDPSLQQIPWRAPEEKEKLTVGVMWDDDLVRPAPPVTRALREVVARLKMSSGIEVIEWKPFQQAEAMEMLYKLYASDGNALFTKIIESSGEPWDPLVQDTFGKDQKNIESLEPNALWEWSMKRDVFRFMYHSEWNRLAPEMNVILCPAGAMPAQPHKTTRYWGYYSVWNLLGYPAAVFPVTRVDPKIDAKEADYTPRNELDRWHYDTYDAEIQKNAPVGLQLVGRVMQDENLVHALRQIKKSVGFPFVDCLAG